MVRKRGREAERRELAERGREGERQRAREERGESWQREAGRKRERQREREEREKWYPCEYCPAAITSIIIISLQSFRGLTLC